MNNIFEWLTLNWSYVISAFFGVVVIASIIVKITPRTDDDTVLRRIINVLDRFSVAKTENDKELIKIAKGYLEENEGDK